MTRSELIEATATTAAQLNTEVQAAIVQGHPERAAGFAEALQSTVSAYMELSSEGDDE